jgi:protoporphyrin/coproporphyrin ferrochelatase
MRKAILLVAHGTVEKLDDMPEFLQNIRHGRPAPPELVEEITRRYLAIGGRSPLLDITHDVARKLEAEVGTPVRVAMRLFRPYVKDVLVALAKEGFTDVFVLPLAQHSAHVYGEHAKKTAAEAGLSLNVTAAPNWGREPLLTKAFAEKIVEALDLVPPDARAHTALVLSAHSLPLSVIEAGDPYEKEFRASAEEVAGAVRALRPDGFAEHVVCFQSEGATPGMKWLGPSLQPTIEALAARGTRHVVLAPIGFLADHVEILYDLDIEAKAWAKESNVVTYRSASLNAGPAFVQALAAIVRRGE